MSALERLAFGWQCLLGALRACGRRALWGPWAALFALQGFAVIAFVDASHPALSAFMAPLLRRLAGDSALRYPELFRRLPVLVHQADLVFRALAMPVAAGIATRLFERHFRDAPLRPAAAWGEGAARTLSLVVAALPVTLVAFGLNAMLSHLSLVRLSSFSRSLAPHAAGGALLFVRAAAAYATALVVLDRRSGPRAIAALPGTWAEGFVPAAVPLLLLAPATALAWALTNAAIVAVDRAAPEWVVLAVIGRSAVETFAMMLVTGAATMAWMGLFADREEAS